MRVEYLVSKFVASYSGLKLLLRQNTALGFPQDLYVSLPAELLPGILTSSLGKNYSLGNHFCRAAKFHSRQPRWGVSVGAVPECTAAWKGHIVPIRRIPQRLCVWRSTKSDAELDAAGFSSISSPIAQYVCIKQETHFLIPILWRKLHSTPCS